jgi:putative membrane protein
VIGKSNQEHRQRGWFQSALAISAASAAASALPFFLQAESITVHMATHAVAMNLFAPALCVIAGFRQRHCHVLMLAGVLQVALLAFWHTPPVAAYNGSVFRFLMHVSLIGIACLFWGSILGSDRRHPAAGIAALLVTGKLVCLGGAILVFAPRPLYFGAGHTHGLDGVMDQQLAGLIMLATCSLAYISGAIVLFWRWLSGIGSAAPVKVPA